MRALVVLLATGCAAIPAALRPAPDPRARPEWVDVHDKAFYQPDGKVILVYGVGSLRADSDLCRPDLVRPIIEGRALPPMQHFLGDGETEVADHAAVITENGREWHHTSTTRERRASGSLFMVTTQGAWYDYDAEELFILRRAVAPATDDLLPSEGIDTSSPQSFEHAMRAYLAACVPPPLELEPTLASERAHPSLEVSPCSGHCGYSRPEPCAPGCSDPRAICQTSACRASPRPVLVTDL